MTMEYRTECRIKKARREAELNRQRRRAVMVIIAVLVFVWIANSGAFSLITTEAASSDAVCVTVHRGDSLWSLAVEYKPEDEEIRQFVRKIANFNNMDSLVVYEGQTIRIPH